MACPASVRAQAEPLELRSVRFEGATAFPAALLRAAIISEGGGCKNILLTAVCYFGIGREYQRADQNALQSDALRLRLFYYERGYREAKIVLDTMTTGGLHAVFRITEGRPVRVGSVRIAGIENVDSRFSGTSTFGCFRKRTVWRRWWSVLRAIAPTDCSSPPAAT